VSERLTLITGRTRKQAIGMHRGKSSPEYLEATGFVEMNADDMERLAIPEGGVTRLSTADGHVELRAQVGELPRGLVFVPMGTRINALIGVETSGSGMPSFKGLAVEVALAGEPGGAP